MERIPKPDLERTQGDMFMEALEKMRMQRQYTDVVLSCGNVQFPAHKVVLCAGSAYFRSLFQSGMRECTTGSVLLGNVSAEAFRIVLRYMYTAKISDVEDVDLLKELLATSHMLQLETLYDYYCQILLDDLTPVDFLEFWDLVSLFDNSAVQEHIVSVLSKRFQQTRQSEDFLYLTKIRLKELLCHPELKCSVDEMVESIIEWVKHDIDGRQGDLHDLLHTVPLASASMQCLELLKNEEIVQSSAEVMLKLSGICESRSVQHDASGVPHDLIVIPKYLGTQEEIKIAVCYKIEGIHFFNVYNASKCEWGIAERIPFTLHPCATVAATPDGDILFIGGASCAGDTIEPLDIVCKYNTSSKCLQYASSMSLARCRPGVGIFRGHVYAVGGKSSLVPVNCSNTVEKYNCVTDRWSSVASTLNQYSVPEVMQVLDSLYVAGFDNLSGDLGVEKYELATRQWSLVRSRVDHHWEHFSATAWDKEILFTVDDENVFHFLDPETGSFQERTFEGGPTSISKMFSRNCLGRAHCVFVLDGDELYAFDPRNKANSWTKMTNSFPPSGSLVGLTVLE